jgi:hypothetical protein
MKQLNHPSKIIGIGGGVGPMAGVKLHEKIIASTPLPTVLTKAILRCITCRVLMILRIVLASYWEKHRKTLQRVCFAQ